MVTNLCRLFVMCVLASSAVQVNASQPVTTETLEGAWELVSYDTADGRPETNGLHLMQDGHFSIAYEMTFSGGELSARSHAGTYAVDGNQITYNVRWWVQHVDGEDAIISATSVSPEFDYDGTNLKLQFSSSSSQHWRRIEAPSED
jgi:hypothetical protein